MGGGGGGGEARGGGGGLTRDRRRGGMKTSGRRREDQFLNLENGKMPDILLSLCLETQKEHERRTTA